MTSTVIIDAKDWRSIQKLSLVSVGTFLIISGLATKSQAVTINNVPAYDWYHGCVPTAAASIYGYWDLLGYNNFFDETGDIYLTTSIQEQISSTAHNNKYDPNPDDPDLPDPPDTSLADFFHTSEGDLNMGWTYNSNIPSGLKDYAEYQGYDFSTVSVDFGGTLTWETLVKQIDSGLPAMLFVDSTPGGDGESDHAIPVIGYEDRGSDGKFYGFYQTQRGDEAENIIWEPFRPLSEDYRWGILGGVFVSPATGGFLNGSSSAKLLNPQPDSPPATFTGMGTNSITWGVPLPDENDPRGSRSTLSFTENNFAVDLDKPFTLGSVTFHNGSIKIAPENTGINSVDLSLELTADLPLLNLFNIKIPLGEDLRQIDIINTRNIPGDSDASADSLFISPANGFDVGNVFNVPEGDTSTASLLGFITQTKSPLGSSFAPGEDTGSSTTSASQDEEPEFALKLLGFGEVTSGNGFITSTSVPEPSTLIGASFALGVGVLSRKQKKSKQPNTSA